MDDVKSIFQSTTFWGIILTGVGSFLHSKGFDVTGLSVPDTAKDLVTLIGMAIAIRGRVKAVKRIGK